ncbi:TIGR02391 family protein [Streptomyces sp. AM 4-1-1]|uniref:TIGR02391 family protein n=1 Tax=Streptomyces sp. AM 4-1-1 TaxID=3028710 RepID=UPI0023B9EF15|nr:TIGR02391 family protein [Streptomyces sp. AM 4-1-1]WEH34798.1 TIGR02391 family protein [Streptomyces sp. AM 4-1-1]
MTLDIHWARGELARFLELTELYRLPDPPGVMIFSSSLSNRGSQRDIVASAHVVEKILDRVLPHWKTDVPSDRNEEINRWCQHREAAQRADAALQRDTEISERLGDNAPQLSAATMHPWVWQGAGALWQSSHFREAVTAAARKVNAETQNKVQRRDLSETKLFQNAFSLAPPKEGEHRLRLMEDDGGDTFRSVHRGAMAFADGCYAGIRNPNSHEDGLPELPEHEALEQLAALSVLARWVDKAAVTGPS